MWFWQKWTKSTCLKQLRMQDSRDPTHTFLYKLSMQPGLLTFEGRLIKSVLTKFKKVVLLSSEQDMYVPFHSARIEVCASAYKDTRLGLLFECLVLYLTKVAQLPKWCAISYFLSYKILIANSPGSNFLNHTLTAQRYNVIFRETCLKGIDGVIGRAARLHSFVIFTYFYCRHQDVG